MKIRIVIAMLSVCTFSTGTGAESPWYVGVMAGRGSSNISEQELQALSIDAVSGGGILNIVMPASSILKSDRSAWSFTTGYAFTKHLTVEASYLKFGEINYQYSGMSARIGAMFPQTLNLVPDSAKVWIKNQGASIAVLGNLPVYRGFELHAKAGALFGQVKTGISRMQRDQTFVVTLTDEKDNYVSFIYGSGATYRIGSQWSVGLDWQRAEKVGSAVQITSNAFIPRQTFDLQNEIDSFMATLAYRF